MASIIGKNTYLNFGSTVLNPVYRNFDSNESVNLVDKSAGADAHDSFIADIQSGDFSVDLLVDGTATFVALAPGTEGTFTYAPEGTASGKTKRSCIAIVGSTSRKNPYNDLVVMTAKFTSQTIWTEGTY